MITAKFEFNHGDDFGKLYDYRTYKVCLNCKKELKDISDEEENEENN
jgi:hypothetical protein